MDAELKQLKKALQDIKEMTDATNPESYRSDDREGCLETVFATACNALEPGSYDALMSRVAGVTNHTP